MNTIPTRKLLISFSGTKQGLLDHIAAAIYLSETIDNCPDSAEFGGFEDVGPDPEGFDNFDDLM